VASNFGVNNVISRTGIHSDLAAGFWASVLLDVMKGFLNMELALIEQVPK
jgi:hypothetical protein